MTAEFNDQVTVIAPTDIRGALGINRDSGTWIESLYVSAEIVGMAISPWMAMTFTLRHSTLFAIVLCCTSSVLIRSAQTSRRYMLCGCCRGWLEA
jgi:DHA2 family multidrug resistance protein